MDLRIRVREAEIEKQLEKFHELILKVKQRQNFMFARESQYKNINDLWGWNASTGAAPINILNNDKQPQNPGN